MRVPRSQSIAYCLREAGLRLADLDHVAVNQDSRAQRLRKIFYAIAHPPDIGLVLERLRNRRTRQRTPAESSRSREDAGERRAERFAKT